MVDEFDDPLGVKEALVESSKIVAEHGSGTIFGLIKSICGGAAEEFGYLLHDQVKFYRAKNLNRLAERYMELGISSAGEIASPRVAMQLLEAASWVEDDELIKMWAGLLGSSLSRDGKDDSNLVFTDLLRKMTVLQARILAYVNGSCEVIFKDGIIWSNTYRTLPAVALVNAVGCDDLMRLDREIDYLRSLDIIRGTFDIGAKPLTVSLSPSPLGLQLYARSNGFKDVQLFYRDQIIKG